MFEIKKVKNYRQFAEKLEKEIGCTVTIYPMDNTCTHIHYQLNDKYGMTLGVLCINDGVASFAPFVTNANAHDDQYINLSHLPQIDDMIKVFSFLKAIFIDNSDK